MHLSDDNIEAIAGALNDMSKRKSIDWKARADAAEAKLRAVSEAAKEKPDRKDHGSYYCASVDSLLSRIGKLAE